jgi:hypothetical protein
VGYELNSSNIYTVCQVGSCLSEVVRGLWSADFGGNITPTDRHQTSAPPHAKTPRKTASSLKSQIKEPSTALRSSNIHSNYSPLSSNSSAPIRIKPSLVAVLIICHLARRFEEGHHGELLLFGFSFSSCTSLINTN